MTKIDAIRHAKTDMNRKGLIVGHLDPLAIHYADIDNMIVRLGKYDIILSSDLKRASDTAFYISKKLGLPVLESKELREIHYGKLSGQRKSLIKKKLPAYHRDAEFTNPGGESFNDLYNRVSRYLKKKAKTYDNILVVTHTGCIRSIYSMCRGEDIQKNINLNVPHDSLLSCDLQKGTAKFI